MKAEALYQKSGFFYNEEAMGKSVAGERRTNTVDTETLSSSRLTLCIG
jgi:hypothetical protein